MRVTAMLQVYDEHRFIGGCIEHLHDATAAPGSGARMLRRLRAAASRRIKPSPTVGGERP
jgi:hypothetical protein